MHDDRTAPADFGAALDDIVVLDLGDEATAWASALLAELGAVVVRVEDSAGDVLRQRGDIVTAVMHAGKRSIVIDIDSEADWQSLDAVLDGVDVVIGPIEPSPLCRRFLDRAAAKSRDGYVGVVDAVFRRDEPAEPVTDLTAVAAGGLTVLSGRPEDPPNHPAGELAWKQTSLAAAEAALALVHAQRRWGRGGHVVVSAQEAVRYTTLQSANGNLFHWNGIVASRHAQLASGSTVQSADDEWVSFTIHPPHFQRFVEWAQRDLDRPVLSAPEWSDPEYVATHRDEVRVVITQLAAVLSREELVREGQARGLLVLPVLSATDIVNEPHLRERDFFVDVPQRNGSTIGMGGSAFRSGRGRGQRRPAPMLGEDQHLFEQLAGTQRSTTTRETAPDGHRQPLAGVRVVDFTWALAGPLSTRLLADLGADVIKIESENRLDPIRQIGPQPGDEPSWDTNGVFNDASANKRAVTLNLSTAEGRDLAARLIKTADVLTANFTPYQLDRWGFDAASLQELRPGLIVANMSVMGLHGPATDWRSYGSGLVAMSGIAAHTGFEGTVPECLGTLHTDFTVPYFGATQILAALHQRNRTGQGVYLELSQYESSVRLMDVEVAEAMAGQPDCGRLENKSPWSRPHDIYPAAGDDRWVAIACRDDEERERLQAVVGALDDESIGVWTKARSRHEIVDTLRRASVPVAAVEDTVDHHSDAGVSQWEVLDLPSGITAEVLHAPVTWDDERLPLRRAPMWMEHTFEVLSEIGVDSFHFADLLERRVLW